MQKKINIFLSLAIFLCSFTLSSCKTNTFHITFFNEFSNKTEEIKIFNEEKYVFYLKRNYSLDVFEKENNNIKIIANEEYFKVDNLTIIPIKKGTNIPIIIYNGFNKTTFFVTISETKNVDLKIMGHPFYSKDEVSINFNYNEPFLNLSKYNIQDVVIGDIIRMYYTGDYFYTEMTWNNFVTVSNIIHVEKSYEAIPYTFIIDENYVPIIIDNEIEYKFHHTVYIYEQYYVINEDNLYTTTDKLEIGQTIYGFAWGNNPNEIASLYTYNPKE